MTSPAAIAPVHSSCSSRGPLAPRGEEAGGEQIARAGRVDHLRRPGGRDLQIRSPFSTASAPCGTAGHDQRSAPWPQARSSAPSQVGARRSAAAPRPRWRTTGRPRRCRSSPRSPPCARRCTRFRSSVKATSRPARVRDLDRLDASPRAAVGTPQIALEVEDRGRGDQRLVERLGASIRATRRARCSSSAGASGGDEDQAAPGRQARRPAAACRTGPRARACRARRCRPTGRRRSGR